MRRFSCAMFAVILAGSVSAADRPKIGLALGGGGARGAAHVGVIRVLEQMHVPIDYIAGTSMGAVVGGLYASGLTTDQIERALTQMDWNDALSDRTTYKELSYRRKEDENRYLTAFEAGLHRGRLALPTGLRSAQKLRFFLQSYLVPVASVHDFSKLPIPFKAVAADIETGDAVVLDHGDLAEAIRASLSLPGIFSPIEIDGRLLVDGGIADNIPVDVVRAMGADVVIAVDVGSPMLKRDKLGSLFAVSNQVLTLLTRRNSEQQLANANVLITPPVSDFGTLAFIDAARIIVLGAQEAERQREQLARYAVSAEQYASARPVQSMENRKLDYVGAEGSRRVDPRIVRGRVRTRPGRPLDPETLRGDVARLYGLDDFQTVNFSIRDDAGQHGIVFELKDKPWGPTYVRFGLNLSDDLRGDSTYGVLINVTQTRINALGAEWRNDIKLGREEGIFSEFYQPLDFSGRFFVAPSIQLVKEKFSFFEGGHRTGLYDVVRRGGALDLGMEFGEWGALRAGLLRGRVRATVDAGALDLPQGIIKVGGLTSSLTIVRTDSPTIPHSGGDVLVQYYGSRRGFGGTEDYSKLSANGNQIFSIGRQSFLVGGAAGTNLNTTLPLYDDFQLGGLLALGGFGVGQLHGQRFALFRTGAYYRLLDLSADIDTGLYSGIFAEAGNAWAAGEHATVHNLHRSITVIVGADTILGPILLGYARAETGEDRFYFTIGKTF